MSVYRRGKIYWYKFWFANKLIRESAKTSSKTLAKEAEKKRRRELEAGYNNLSQDFRNQRVLTLRQAADKYSADYTIRYPSSSVKYQKYCVKHLVDHLGDKMLIEITDKVVQAYQVARLREGSAGKTINRTGRSRRTAPYHGGRWRCCSAEIEEGAEAKADVADRLRQGSHFGRGSSIIGSSEAGEVSRYLPCDCLGAEYDHAGRRDEAPELEADRFFQADPYRREIEDRGRHGQDHSHE